MKHKPISVEEVLARSQRLNEYTWQMRALKAEAEVARLKTVMKEIAQDAHLVSIRLANGAISIDDLKEMLAREL